jgi:hypothetical protein
VTRTEWTLFVLSVPFLLESLFEMIIVTAIVGGPVMLFWGVIHNWPSWAAALFLGSYAAYYVLLLFTAGKLIVRWFRRRRAPGAGVPRASKLLAGLAWGHMLLFVLYVLWAQSVAS